MASSEKDNGTRKTIAGVAATAAAIGQMAYAQGTGKIKVGLLGCGDEATRAPVLRRTQGSDHRAGRFV